ncbi:MAG: hypothetical protein ACTSUE_08645 [Promethearchaeota archaeon]
MSKKIAGLLLQRQGKSENAMGLWFLLSIITLNAISIHFFMVTLRSIIIAPAIFNDLIPLLAGILLAPFIAALFTIFMNSHFMAVLGVILQIFGRAMLLEPGNLDNNHMYYAGMISLIFGQVMLFVGLIAANFKHVKLKGELAVKPEEQWMATIGGIIVGFALNVVSRSSGIEISENITFNIFLAIGFLVALASWFPQFQKVHNVLKNIHPDRVKKNKGTRNFRKTLHLLVLAPCFCVMGFIFNRFEWIATALQVNYNMAGIMVAASISASPLVMMLLGKNQDMKDMLGLICLCLGIVGLGFMYFLPSGIYLGLFIFPVPIGIYNAFERVFRLTGRVHVRNIDISIILAWIVIMFSLLVTTLLNFLFLFPWVNLILLSIPIAHAVINQYITTKKGVNDREGGSNNDA